jgi:hypothetical protein
MKNKQCTEDNRSFEEIFDEQIMESMLEKTSFKKLEVKMIIE